MGGADHRAPDPSRGMVFQDYGLFPWLTVRQNIGFGPAFPRAPCQGKSRKTVDHFMDLVGLGPLRPRRSTRISFPAA